MSADVTDCELVAKTLDEAQSKMGQITGIIHGAGNLADKKIENKTARDYSIVYDTKILGLKNIFNCISSEKIEQLIYSLLCQGSLVIKVKLITRWLTKY